MNNDLLGKLSICGVAALLSIPAITLTSGCKSDDTADEAGTAETVGDGDGDPTGDGDGDPTGDGDGDPTGDGDGDPTGDGDGDPGGLCEATHAPGDGAANGDPCFSNGECASKLCELFQDVPTIAGTCEAASPTDVCETRIMGRILDFTTQATVAEINLRVAQAIQASVDPVGAAGLAVGTSDANGVIDTLSDGQIASALGIVGLADGGSYYLTATGLASPAMGTNYGPANAIRDIWVVPAQSLTDWSDALMSDPEVTNELPLGEAGGVVGLVRDRATGDLIEGAVVVPTNGGSGAVIRYLNAAGDDFVSDMTTTSGVFVIVNPGLGETFGLEIGGMDQGLTGTGGSANGAIFTLIMNVSM